MHTNRLAAFVALLAALAAANAANAQDQAQDQPQDRRLRLKVIELDQNQAEAKAKDGAADAPISKYWLGVAVRAASDTVKSQLKIEDGLVADYIVENSPAAKAGVLKHDVLLELNGRPLRNMVDMLAAVEAAGEKETTLSMIREGKRQTIEITPAPRPENDNNGVFGQAHPLANPDIQRLLEEVLKRGDAGRFLFVRPPVFEQGAKLPQEMKLNIRRGDDQEERVEVWIDGKKYEASSIEELPAEVRKHLDILGASPGKLNLNDKDLELFKLLPGANAKRSTKDKAKQRGADAGSAGVLKKMQRQMDQLQKELEQLKSK